MTHLSTNQKKLAGAVSAALLTLATSANIHAQTVATSDQPASAGVVVATTANTDTATVQEVIITSQKRAEKLKDVPVSVSVVSTDDLTKANATDVAEISNLVPSVQLNGSFNGRVPMAMRGISSQSGESAIGVPSGVSLMVDGVPVPSDSISANELDGIQRVEVLKGPQSTLGGRAASAGIINFVTKGPSDSLTGDIEAVLTNDHESKESVYIAGPLSESGVVTGSIAVYNHDVVYPITNLADSEKSESRAQGVRAKIRIKPSSDLDFELMVHDATIDSIGSNFVYQYITPGAKLFGALPSSVTFPGVNIAPGNTDYNSVTTSSSKTTDKDISLVINKRFNDYTFTSTTARMTETQNIVQDVPIIAVYFWNILQPNAPHFYNAQTIKLSPNTTVQEFKLASPIDAPVSFVAGLYYSDINVTSHQVRTLPANAVNAFADDDSKTLDVYGRATWQLAKSTSLLTGLRYNHDTISYAITEYPFSGGSFNPGASSTSGTAIGDLTLRQKINDSMAYATYSKGYAPAVYNAGVIPTNNTPQTPVGATNINHFELGDKSTLLDGQMQLGVALFNTDYKNYQVEEYPSGSFLPAPVLTNAGEAKTSGLELDLNYRYSSATTLRLNTALIDPKFVSFNNAACYGGQTQAQGCMGHTTQNLSGAPMPNAPKLKVVLNAEHRIVTDKLPFELALDGEYSWRSSANFLADQNPAAEQNAFGILNLSATASDASKSYAVTFFVNNVLNKFYLVDAEDFMSGFYGGNAVIGQPARDAQRYAGVRFNYSF